MRLTTIARVREQARALARKVRRAAVFVVVATLLLVSLVVGKNVLLREVRAGVRKSFAYDSLHLSYFPPALVLTNVRSLDEPPTLRAKSVRIEVPFVSILRNRKVMTIVLNSPEVRIRPRPAAAPRRPARPTTPSPPAASSHGKSRAAALVWWALTATMATSAGPTS